MLKCFITVTKIIATSSHASIEYIVQLFEKILAGAHRMLVVDEHLSHSTVDKVFVGQTKEMLSIVDQKLVVDDVCSVFGQHVQYVVIQAEPVCDQEASSTGEQFKTEHRSIL